eukprot:3921346-Rhodomonas_salina.2
MRRHHCLPCSSTCTSSGASMFRWRRESKRFRMRLQHRKSTRNGRWHSCYRSGMRRTRRKSILNIPWRSYNQCRNCTECRSSGCIACRSCTQHTRRRTRPQSMRTRSRPFHTKTRWTGSQTSTLNTLWRRSPWNIRNIPSRTSIPSTTKPLSSDHPMNRRSSRSWCPRSPASYRSGESTRRNTKRHLRNWIRTLRIGLHIRECSFEARLAKVPRRSTLGTRGNRPHLHALRTTARHRLPERRWDRALDPTRTEAACTRRTKRSYGSTALLCSRARIPRPDSRDWQQDLSTAEANSRPRCSRRRPYMTLRRKRLRGHRNVFRRLEPRVSTKCLQASNSGFHHDRRQKSSTNTRLRRNFETALRCALAAGIQAGRCSLKPFRGRARRTKTPAPHA